MPKKRNRFEVAIAVVWAGSLGLVLIGVAIAWVVRFVEVLS